MREHRDPVPLSVWRRIAMASWRQRTDPAILASVDVDAEALLGYIADARRATGVHVTPMHLVGRAVARAFAAMPGINGRVVAGGFRPSPTVDAFFVVSLETEALAGAEAARASATDMSGSVVRNADEKTPWAIATELADRAERIRSDRDPQFRQAKAMVRYLPPLAMRWLLRGVGFWTESLQRALPLMGLEARPYGSFLVSNVGTYGLDSAYAPVPPFCRVPVTLLVGAVKEQPVAVDGQVVVRPVLPVGVTIDHRFVDGFQVATLSRMFLEYLADPAAFDPVPVVTTPARWDRSQAS